MGKNHYALLKRPSNPHPVFRVITYFRPIVNPRKRRAVLFSVHQGQIVSVFGEAA
jgi:hypothetical protein